MIRFRIFSAIVLIAAAAAFVRPAGAGEKAPDGKALYKQNCRVCHDKGSANGEYSPMSLIQDQWQSFFKTRLEAAHKDVKAPGSDKKLLESLSPEEIKAIHKFCVDHAADSEQPQTCG
jgi:cytochrome c5